MHFYVFENLALFKHDSVRENDMNSVIIVFGIGMMW